MRTHKPSTKGAASSKATKGGEEKIGQAPPSEDQIESMDYDGDEVACSIKTLPEEDQVAAAATATAINPGNGPVVEMVQQAFMRFFPELMIERPDEVLEPAHLAVMTSKYWGQGGVDLTVGFMESIAQDLRDKLLLYMNKVGGNFANIKFRWTQTNPQIRITRSGDGYWSYLGTDILSIPRNQPTMSLRGFTMQTKESEFLRVVQHETLHSCGCPHEHMRPEIINRLDVQKTIAWGQAVLGWNESMVRSQILTPISEASIMGTPHAEEESIMAYMLPGSITKDGRPVKGGADLTANDKLFLSKIYPLTTQPPPPVGARLKVTMDANGRAARIEIVDE